MVRHQTTLYCCRASGLKQRQDSVSDRSAVWPPCPRNESAESALARELRDSFGELIIIIKGAEVLGLVDTPGGDVVLQPLGKRVIETPVNEKKRLIAERIAGLPLFAHFRRYLAGREDHAASRSEVLEEIVRILPTERPKPQYDTLVNWGRYAEIFTYSRDEDKLRLAEPLA